MCVEKQAAERPSRLDSETSLAARSMPPFGGNGDDCIEERDGRWGKEKLGRGLDVDDRGRGVGGAATGRKKWIKGLM